LFYRVAHSFQETGEDPVPGSEEVHQHNPRQDILKERCYSPQA